MRVRQLSKPAAGTALACALLMGGWFAGPVSGRAGAASHVDAPSTFADPPRDGSDLYAFTSPEAPDTVTIATDYHPLQLPGNAVTLYPFMTDTRYEIHADSSGDGRPEVTYRYTFRTQDKRPSGTAAAVTAPVRSLADKAVVFRQTYTLEELRPGKPARTLVDQGAVAPSYAGSRLMPDYDALRKDATKTLPGGGRSYVGQIADSFLFNIGPYAKIRFGIPLVPEINPVSLLNANTMTLQVPKQALAFKGDPRRNPVIGIWATASRRTVDVQGGEEAAYAQVSRMGQPHVLETMFPDSLPVVGVPGGLSDQFQTRSPAQDGDWGAMIKQFREPFAPRNISFATGAAAPANPRTDLVDFFMNGVEKVTTFSVNQDVDRAAVRPAEVLRLNMSTPVSKSPHRETLFEGDPEGYPNGRRFVDDADAIQMRALMGGLLGAETGFLTRNNLIKTPPKPSTGTFPYRPLPH
ncbi:DUF4331 domain-containing protein [Streptomyces sp. TRM66268-LWL]|uniref:DUF4331 domain-containing protein n=1 Tax=Streptomyces polyasparticus TaxID=2767826 RepID=A0ABR7SH72_9ACTN|nr:DUF4331 domain-containing protein [Streptomyces polyasparticus]MBC9713708.1 DUF4331 domain-containing protein [Streptomyces polyasparticus]